MSRDLVGRNIIYELRRNKKLTRDELEELQPLTVDHLMKSLRHHVEDQEDATWQHMKPYMKWIITRYASNGIKFWEDVPDILDGIWTYDRLKKRGMLESNQKDINKFKGEEQLFDLLEDYSDVDLSSQSEADDKYEDDLLKRNHYEKLYEDSQWKVVKINSEEASCYFGRGTRWCTSGRNNNMFDFYNEDGTLIVFRQKGSNEAYQLFRPDPSADHQDFQFMDAKDRQATVDKVIPRDVITKALSYRPPDMDEIIFFGYVDTWKDLGKLGYDDDDIVDALFGFEKKRRETNSERPIGFFNGYELKNRTLKLSSHNDYYVPYKVKVSNCKFILDKSAELYFFTARIHKCTFELKGRNPYIKMAFSEMTNCDMIGSGFVKLDNTDTKKCTLIEKGRDKLTVAVVGDTTNIVDTEVKIREGDLEFDEGTPFFARCKVILPNQRVGYFTSLIRTSSSTTFIFTYEGMSDEGLEDYIDNIEKNTISRKGGQLSFVTKQ